MNGRWQDAIQYLSAELENEPDVPNDVEANRTVLFDVIVQSIYAADREEDAYRALLEGIHMGFHLSGVRIYRAYAGSRRTAPCRERRSGKPYTCYHRS